MPVDSDVITAAEAAAYLGSHVETVRRLARRGQIPSFKVGTDWRFSRTALRRWAHRQGSGADPADVLIVDDDALMVSTLCRVVGWLGCHTRSATSGEEAIELIRARTPDVILLDLVMPGMTGPDVLEQIRPIFPDLPVVIVTGYPDSDLMHRAAQQPPVMLMVKPVDPEQVEGTLRAVLGDRLPKR